MILNEIETEQLSNQRVESIDDAKSASLILINKFGLKKGVIVTLGEQGVIYTDKEKHTSIHIKTPKVNVVDSTVS